LLPDRLNGIGDSSPVVEASVHGLRSGYAWESGLICTVGHVWVPDDVSRRIDEIRPRSEHPNLLVPIQEQVVTAYKDQVQGRLKEVQGKIKETAGKLMGNKELQAKGKAQKTRGKAQAKFGDVKQKLKVTKKKATKKKAAKKKTAKKKAAAKK
jgi:uncharacterized protein YjbJ (UPF0337 family)